jgi:hypothetical protein
MTPKEIALVNRVLASFRVVVPALSCPYDPNNDDSDSLVDRYGGAG